MGKPLVWNKHCQKQFTRCLVLVLAGVIAGGCSNKPTKPLPKTYPVTGKVVNKQGKTIAGSMQWQPTENGEFRAMGEVLEDGTFALYTLLVDGQKLAGAVEGSYSSTFFPFSKGHSILPVRIKEKYTVEPRENHFLISLPNGS